MRISNLWSDILVNILSLDVCFPSLTEREREKERKKKYMFILRKRERDLIYCFG